MLLPTAETTLVTLGRLLAAMPRHQSAEAEFAPGAREREIRLVSVAAW